MTETLSISERGLRLIKAFEGYRPVDRVLVTGTRVVGHGHRLTDDTAVIMSREQAHEVLLDDLAPFEDMINETVFAAITQGQFDALVSLAFNIGPRAFLDSDVLRAVNAGRPLDAAAGFDVWRRANVAGQTFVVDALVRRRTAEKALFLRPGEGMLTARAPGSDLDPLRDPDVSVEMDAPQLDRDGAGRLVADAPYELSRLISDLAVPSGRRRDDGPAGEMALTEREASQPDPVETDRAQTIYSGLDSVLVSPSRDDNVIDEDSFDDDASEDDVRANAPSPIAIAADEVRDRLDALMGEDLVETSDDELREGFDDERYESLEELITTSSAVDGELDADVMDLGPADRVESDRIEDVADTPVVGNDNETVVPFPTQAARLGTPDDGALVDDESILDVPEADLAPVAIDNLAQDAAVRDRGRMGISMDADWSPGSLVEPRGPSAWPYALLFMLGGALFGTGAILMTRGSELLFGQPRELVGLAGALIGAMLILGALFYLLKTTMDGDRK